MIRKIALFCILVGACSASTTPPEVACSGASIDPNHACGMLVTAAEARAADIGCTLDPRARIAADGVCRSGGASIDGCLDALDRAASCREIDEILRACATCAL